MNLLVHGQGMGPKDNWFPSIYSFFSKKSLTIAPEFPNSYNPILSQWLEKLNHYNPHTYFGYSCGAKAIILHLQNIAESKNAVLVAPFIQRDLQAVELYYGQNWELHKEIITQWDDAQLDISKLHHHNIDLIISENDPIVPFDDRLLQITPFIHFVEARHFTRKSTGKLILSNLETISYTF